MTLNFYSSCLHLPSVGIARMFYHAWFMQHWG